MQYRALGRTGVDVSCLCLGTDNFAHPTPEEEAAQIIDHALDAGINLIDTGEVYADGEAERIIGRALVANGRRQSVLISTKINPDKHGPGHSKDDANVVGSGGPGQGRLDIIRACEDSLRRLQTDYIDLYQLHRPFPIPIEETLGALDDLVRQGKVRHIGCSTHPAWSVMEAIMVSEKKGYARFVSEQPPYNLLDRRIENELVPMCQAHGLGLIPWSPLATGVLAGRYKSSEPYPSDSRAALRGEFYADRVSKRGVEISQRFSQLAEEAGISPAELAVLWVKDQPGVTAPIIGPRTVAHLENLLPVVDMSLDQSLAAACDELVAPGSAVADFYNTADWMKMRIS